MTAAAAPQPLASSRPTTTPQAVAPELAATVTIEGAPRPIKATVTKVSVLPDNTNRWYDPDRKDYPIDLQLEYTPPGLKPGMTAKVDIFLDRLEHVLAVPMAAVYSVGDRQYVFVRDHGLTGASSNNPRPQVVKVGQVNESHVELIDGVRANDEVLLLEAGQGRALLEAAGLSAGQGTPAAKGSTQPVVTAAPS
jgi:multidrug efflux pump subunit AcrA (membrane-fusion protein)